MLSIYNLEQSDKWDETVKSFAEYDTYWLSGYTKAFKIHGDGEPLLFYYEGNGVRAINAVMLRDISRFSPLTPCLSPNTLFDIVTPYGYGGWLVEGGEMDFSEYEEYCREHNIVSEFVRFHPVMKNHRFCEKAYEVIGLGNTVMLDLSSEETIWANITSKNRNVIRKAEKNGVVINSGRSAELYETFRGIYNATMDKDNAEEYYYFGPEFYESVLNDLPENARVYYAELEDKIIAACIVLNANGRLNYHLSGSVREYSNLAPGNLMLYTVAREGCEAGYKTFYLGGGVGSGEDSLFKFKRAFNRTDEALNQFFIGKKIFLPDVYDELVNMRTDLPESNYFPKYRA